MDNSDIIWAALILLGAAYEGYALRSGRSGDTLSETTRALFRTRRGKAGRVAFLAVWLGFSAWFCWHILWQ
jgi:hypothetical protein